MSLYESIDIINFIIKEKRWSEFTKMEVINAFYILIKIKYTNENSSIYVNSSISIIKFFSLWTLISLIKFWFEINQIITTSFIILYLITHINKKKILLFILFYSLLIFNVNDILISIILICNKIIYLVFSEMYFFMKNIYSIKKILNFNNDYIEKDYFYVNK
jgi:hypothetical protein